MSDTRHGGILAVTALQDAGIEALFALPGGHVLPILDGARRLGLRLIDTRHEENAVLMAGGWALTTGRPAAAAVTAGPGLTNALPGIAEVNASGIPAVVIAGRTALSQQGRGAVQDVDQMAVVAPVTKWRARCLRVERIPEMVDDAVHQARSGAPGVAYLEIPQDVLTARGAANAGLDPMPGHAEVTRPRPAPVDVAHAAELLAQAARPAVLAGSGAFFAGAGDALAGFAERTGIPVITTAAARGLLPDDHPMCAGGLVHGGVTLVSADVALVLGSRFNANLVYGGLPLFSPDLRVIQVDIRPEHLGGGRRPTLAMTGDVTATLEALTDEWAAPPDRFAGWLEDARNAAAASRATWAAESEATGEGIHPGLLARETARIATEQGAHTFVSDGGDSVVWGMAMSHAAAPGTNLAIGSAMGTLGVGTPFAVAAKAARPDQPVFLFTGDGAFGMSAMELDTAASYGLPIVVVVVNNGGWGDTRQAQVAAYGEEGRTGVTSTMRYDLLGAAVGGHGEQISRPREIRPALERAVAAGREGKVAVIDAICDPEAVSAFMANVKGLELM